MKDTERVSWLRAMACNPTQSSEQLSHLHCTNPGSKSVQQEASEDEPDYSDVVADGKNLRSDSALTSYSSFSLRSMQQLQS